MSDLNSIKHLDEYVRGSELFIIEASRQNLIKGILNSEHNRDNLSQVKINTKNLDLMRFNFEKSCHELSTIEQAHESINLDKENDPNLEETELNRQKENPKDIANKSDVQAEIIRAQAVLEMLQSEKLRCDTSVIEEKDRLLRIQDKAKTAPLLPASPSDIGSDNPDVAADSLVSNPRLKQLKSSRDE
jgi:hypothetical protein